MAQEKEIVKRLELPRLDWFDEAGRIYKDALIENFNAIEKKLIEVSQLDAFELKVPDISTIVYPDVTMDSPTNCIINLKSLLDITGLIGFPIECQFSGTKAKKIAYWSPSYKYEIIKDVDTDATDDKPYIYLNYVDKTVISSAETVTPENSKFIGCYVDGVIRCVNSSDYIGVNVLYYLARMSEEMYDYVFHAGTRDMYRTLEGIGKNGRVIGAADTNKKTHTVNYVTFRDVGRYSN